MERNITKVDVTSLLCELDGVTPITDQDTCPGCIEVYRKIHDLLLPNARKELLLHERKITEIVTKKPELITPRIAINRALCTTMKNDEAKPELVVGRYNLAERIFNNDEVSLSPEEIIVIKDRVTAFYQLQPMVSAQICRLVDPTMREQKL